MQPIWNLCFALLFVSPAFAVEVQVANEAELKRAISVAQPGDVIALRDGEWRDVSVVFVGAGTESAPIVLRAETNGKVVFSGKSSLKIAGEHLVVEGLLFSNPDPKVADLIQFRKDSKQLAKRCRLTQCAVVSNRAADGLQESRWVGIYGEGNRVDHSMFEGKSGKGATCVVWLGDKNRGRHRIDHNYFGAREKLGTNGGETLRIGDSKTSMLKADCVVEKNLFEKCNGEAECISNKSCGNIYRANTFLEVSGTLTLRHGNECLVENNCFLGNDASGTGGIRVIGEDHTVRGNYLERLTGDNARSAITLMMGIPNSPANRYFQVRRATIENNTIVNCKHSILIGLSDDKLATLPPIETVFVGNQIASPKLAAIEARCDLDGITWTDNRFQGKALGIDTPPGISLLEISALNRDDTRAIEVKPLNPISRKEVGVAWLNAATAASD